jgi:hypothetical protein
VLSARALPSSCKEDIWGNQVNFLRESAKKRDGSKGATIQRGFQAKAEESPLLKAFTRERLVKTQQAEKT